MSVGDEEGPLGMASEEIAAIREALEHDEYEWRTIGGVARDSGVPAERVSAFLRGGPPDIVRSSIPSKDGHELFTTLRHYEKNASPIQRISSAFRNRKA